MMLNSDFPLWKDSNKLNFVKIRLLDMEKLVIKDQYMIYKIDFYIYNINPLMANFSILSNLIFTRFSLLKSSQRGESEFNIII